MGSFSLFHWIIVILVVMLLFGRGKISELMGDVAKGINSFKKGLADDANAPATPHAPPPSQITAQPQPQPLRDEVPRS
jgi:sec-independent protein translocase protein TatA